MKRPIDEVLDAMKDRTVIQHQLKALLPYRHYYTGMYENFTAACPMRVRNQMRGMLEDLFLKHKEEGLRGILRKRLGFRSREDRLLLYGMLLYENSNGEGPGDGQLMRSLSGMTPDALQQDEVKREMVIGMLLRQE